MDEGLLADANTLVSTVLSMPELSNEALQGLQRTFTMYVRFPQDRWGDIEVAERLDAIGDEMHAKLSDELRLNYASG